MFDDKTDNGVKKSEKMFCRQDNLVTKSNMCCKEVPNIYWSSSAGQLVLKVAFLGTLFIIIS